MSVNAPEKCSNSADKLTTMHIEQVYTMAGVESEQLDHNN